MSRTIRIDWHCECGDGESVHYSSADGEHCYGHCQKTDHDCAGLGYRPIAHTRRPAHFAAILAKAAELRIPEHYTCDLSTDYQTLLNYEGDFIWIVRTMGTHLYLLDGVHSDDGRVWQRNYVRSALTWHERNPNEQQYVFYWDSQELDLRQVTYEQAQDLAANRLADPVRYERRAIPGTPFGYRVEA